MPDPAASAETRAENANESAAVESPGATPARFSIRIKLLLITSVLILAATLSMTLFASRLFRDHSETLIQNYNLSLARLIGQKADQELRDVAYRTRLLSAVLEEPQFPADRAAEYARMFFAVNDAYVFVGLAERGPNDGLVFQRELYNDAFFRKNDIERKALLDVLNSHESSLAQSFEGALQVQNLSPGFFTPILGVSLPAAGDVIETGAPNAYGGEGDAALQAEAATRPGSDRILVVILESSRLLQSFQSAGETEVFDIFLVNERGGILAHSDEALALAGGSAEDLPIVRSLLESEGSNRSLQYRYNGENYLGSYQLLSFGRMGVVSTVSAERAFEAVYAIQSQNFWIMIIIVTLAFLFVWFFARTLSRPIQRLAGAARQIEAGQYDVRVDAAGRDEIGSLARAFQSMARGLAEKERIKGAFGKFVNPEIVRRALENDLRLGGETRRAAILFSDLRNFTGMSEQMQPQEVVSILNDYFTRMVDAIHASGGVVDKFIGDAIMAHWGAVVSSENDSAGAIDAALGMRRALLEFNREFEAKHGRRLQFGVGINTGEVLAGQLGSERRLEYTVIGDAVNLASRIEYLNKHFGADILISEKTLADVEGLYRVARMPPIRIKGKTNPETVFAVLGRINDPEAPRSLTELRELVGIDYDLRSARKFIEASSDALVDDAALTEGQPQ